MRFYKEFDGFIFEFNSWREYFMFVPGRLVGLVIALGAIALILYGLYLYGQ